MTIAVDFDGTLVENLYPDIGEINKKLLEKLIQLKKMGAEIILWTCREGDLLQNALNFCSDNGLEFDYVNANSTKRMSIWCSNPRKIGADYYIDDKSVSPNEFSDKVFECVGENILEKYVPKCDKVAKIVLNTDGCFPEFSCCKYEPYINHPQDLNNFKFCPNCGTKLINTIKYRVVGVK